MHQSHMRDARAKKKFARHQNSLCRAPRSRRVCRSRVSKQRSLRCRRDCAARTFAKLSAIYNERRFSSFELLEAARLKRLGSATMAGSNDVVIIAGCRTPIGKFQGSLSDIDAQQLGAIAVREAVKRANLQPQHVDEG